MSQRTLELNSYYRSESHLFKEYLIRMDKNGMSLFDKNERATLDNALQ